MDETTIKRIYQNRIMMLRVNERLTRDGRLPFDQYGKLYYQTVPQSDNPTTIEQLYRRCFE